MFIKVGPSGCSGYEERAAHNDGIGKALTALEAVPTISADTGEVERLKTEIEILRRPDFDDVIYQRDQLRAELIAARRNLIDEPLYKEDGSYTPIAQNIYDHARVNAIRECVEAVNRELTYSDDIADDKRVPFDDLAMRDRAVAALGQLPAPGDTKEVERLRQHVADLEHDLKATVEHCDRYHVDGRE